MEDLENNFSKYTEEANNYINQLASDLDHPEEQNRVLIAWRAVMHTVRDRIQISESFDLISSLPMIMKGMYTLGWKYHETPPLDYTTIEEMKVQVKARQNQYGESDFDWNKGTDEIISIVMESLSRYLTEDHIEHIRSQLPDEVKPLVS